MVEATDPLGGTEHLEFHNQNTLVPNTEPAALVPTGFSAFNENLQFFNSFHWSKRQWALHPGDVTKATRTHWLLFDLNHDDQSHGSAGSIPHSVKQPLENRVWYAYAGQGAATGWVGSSKQPERVGRVLDDGMSQIVQTTYNQHGHVTSTIDPVGRRTSYTYAANGIDLLEVRQTTGALNDLVASYGSYTSQHAPQTVTDAAGQVTTMTYNAAGQFLTATNAKSETTTYSYNSNGFLQSITGPVSGATTTYAYDGHGRMQSVTDADGYTVTTQYDAGDRITRSTFPDGTYEESVFDRLDVAATRDRLGRWTRLTHDASRRLLSTRDPLGRTITQQWCGCGSLDALIDAKGQKTSWQRDVQGRVTREVRADGVTDTVYAYEATTSRLKTVTDPKLQVTTYSYNLDDTRQSVTFTNAVIATPSVSFAYDPAYNRQATMVDGTGTTSYVYHPVGVLGAGQMASVDGPLANDTITYAHDELGRVTTRAVNGVATTQTYDALGRVSTEVNVLGTFTYGYHGTTSRLVSVLYPNGQTSTYTYFGVATDHRLQTIHHRRPDTLTLSKHDYTYDPVGNILTWQQHADSTSPEIWRHTYDAADQLATAVKSSTGGSPTILSRYAYAYDPAANRTTEQIGDAATLSTHDALNRVIQQQPGGALRFAGTISEPATVTIQGKPALVDASNAFNGKATTVAGTNTVAIQALDASGNVTNVQYEVTSSGSGRTFSYDANGNLTSDGTRTFEWDARNQLVTVTVGSLRSEFTYDGQQRRVRVVEKENGVTQSDRRIVWCESDICEERSADGAIVLKRLFELGEQDAGASRFFAADHLGSITDVADSSAALLARYGFDPWGRQTLLSGTDVTSTGYTGHQANSTAGTWLAQYRGYDADLGRWISQDPLGLADGPNLYAYVRNNPVNLTDPFGLEACEDQEERKPPDPGDPKKLKRVPRRLRERCKRQGRVLPKTAEQEQTSEDGKGCLLVPCVREQGIL